MVFLLTVMSTIPFGEIFALDLPLVCFWNIALVLRLWLLPGLLI